MAKPTPPAEAQNRGPSRLETETHPFSSPELHDDAWLVPTLTLLCHPQAQRVGERAVLTELSSGRRVELSRLTPLFSAPGGEPQPLGDVHLSRRPVLLVPGPQPVKSE